MSKAKLNDENSKIADSVSETTLYIYLRFMQTYNSTKIDQIGDECTISENDTILESCSK